MTGIMQVPAASAATSTGVTAGEQVDLTDVAPSGAKQSFAPAAESFSMAVSEQAMRMRVMDGVLKRCACASTVSWKLARPYPSLRDVGNSPSRR